MLFSIWTGIFVCVVSLTLADVALSFLSLLCELILELFIVRGHQVSVGISGYWYQQESVDVSIKGYRCQ